MHPGYVSFPSLALTNLSTCLPQDGNSYMEAPRTWRRNYQLTDQQRRLLAPTEYKYEGNSTTVLNCTQPFVACVRLECGSVDYPSPETNTIVTLSMRVKIHELGEYRGWSLEDIEGRKRRWREGVREGRKKGYNGLEI